MTQIPGLYIAPSDIAGRGVFTSEAIAAGNLVEMAPVIVIPPQQVAVLHETVLHDFYFRWGPQQKEAAIVLGLGSLYNHSYRPNLRFELDYGNRTVDYYALRDIPAGAELTTNYNGDPEDDTPLWFTESGTV